MSFGGNEPLCISRGKDVLLVYIHAFRGTPFNTQPPCLATSEGDTHRPPPRRPSATCRPRPAGTAGHTGGGPRPGPALTARPSDELHRSRGHQRGNGLVADQMLRALLQVDGVLPAETGQRLRCLSCFAGTHAAFVKLTYLHALHGEAYTYLCSSISGSTRMFSCRSNTLRNTKESRLGFGTADKGFRAQAQHSLMFPCSTPS